MVSNLTNNLPDSLLTNEIISRLPVDEVVRTSLLSKRWKGLLRYVSCFDFNPKRMMRRRKQILCTQKSNRELFHDVVMINNVLLSHSCDLITCKISHFHDSCKYGQLEYWIQYLIKHKRIQELALTCKDFPGSRRNESKLLYLPYGIFSCAYLHALELIRYKIENHEPFHHCLNLKTLKLKYCSLSTETLDGIISSCGFLECLSVCYCTGLDWVRVVSDKVKTLELQCLEVQEVYLSTKSLKVLVLDSLSCTANNLVIDAPMLILCLE